ncbi:MAG: phosphodiester glycosidase family protein [Treponema sp.]|nr:phosphodiester glycosidase family protein [Treponema sp.]
MNKNKSYFKLFTFTFLLSFFLFSCASNHAIITSESYEEKNLSLYIPSQVKWEKIENLNFARYFYFENKEYPVCYHCLKIDLSSPNLKILTYPSSEKDFTWKNEKKTDYFPGLRAKAFSKKYKSQITMNTAPFGGKNGKWDALAKITSSRRICGIHVVDKKRLSEPIEKYSALLFKKNEGGFTGKIIKNQKEEEVAGWDYAFGGFFTILNQGEKEVFSWASNDSRSAAGLSKDGKILYLLVVEGERWQKSHGLTYPECADIMKKIGAYDAMEMDGGGSASLFINGENQLSYPSLRKNAVFLGFSEN